MCCRNLVGVLFEQIDGTARIRLVFCRPFTDPRCQACLEIGTYVGAVANGSKVNPSHQRRCLDSEFVLTRFLKSHAIRLSACITNVLQPCSPFELVNGAHVSQFGHATLSETYFSLRDWKAQISWKNWALNRFH